MRFSAVATALISIGVASAQTTYTIIVGGNNSLTYKPTNINASVGDVIAFQFQSNNHTVTQSTFAAPCENMTKPTQGIDSGFQLLSTNTSGFPQWSFIMTNASAPLWFYCRQTGHCEAGMVFAINPTTAMSFNAFQAAAKNSSSNGAPGSAASGWSPSAFARLLAVGGVFSSLLL